MKSSDKILKAKVKLILDQPFFATLALKMQYVEDPTIKTACTNGKQIKYNPSFIDKLSLDETVGLLAHEVMHPACLHHTRMKNRNPRKWNIAADYAINPMLTASGFKLPSGALIHPQYADLGAEEIYSMLPDDPNNDPNNPGNSGDPGDGGDGGDPGGCGGVEASGVKTQQEADQIEAEMKQTLAQAATIAKQRGKMPAHLKRLVDEILAPHVPWKEVLSRFLNQIAHNDYSWSKPNRRYLHTGLYLPSLESIETGDIVLFVDTSGSIDRTLLNQFAAEMQDIAETFKTGFKILYIDSQVAGVQDVEPGEFLELNPKGGGGTDFIPGFTWLEKNGIEPSAVVYFTDGCCNSFPKDPGYPTLWALDNNKAFQPPFGECVHL